MTLVFESKTTGPGTHALIIGAGASRSSAFPSTELIVTWLRKKFHNPTAPLASIEFLASSPQRGFPMYQASVDEKAFALDPPEDAKVRYAAQMWMHRADSHEDNIALFYFEGASIANEVDTLLILDDFPDRSDAAILPGFWSIPAAMRYCKANRQIYFLDTSRDLDTGFRGVPLLSATPSDLKPPRRTIVHSAGVDLRGPAAPTGPTDFAAALVATLDSPSADGRGRTISTGALVAEIDIQLARIAKDKGAIVASIDPDGVDDFDFHYQFPAKLPDSAESGGEAAPAEIEAAAVTTAAPEITPATIVETSSTAAGTATASAKAKAVPAPRSKPATKRQADTVRKRATQVKLPSPTATSAHRSEYEPETDTDFIPDDAETERDALGRSALAIALARRLHRIWRKTNAPAAAAGAELRAAFVLHLDARWGGGKTTFANFLARVLDPRLGGGAEFLRQRYADADLGGIFVADPPVDAAAATQLARQLPEDARRPWIIVPFNAWQAEHCAPPWWVFYQAIRKGCFDAIKAEGDDPWVPRAPDPPAGAPSWPARLAQRWRRLRAAVRRTDRWLGLVEREYLWRLGNPKIVSLLLTGVVGGAMLLALFLIDATHLVGSGALIVTGGAGLLAAGLTGIGAIWGLGALFTESIIPGTDTLAERLSLGNGDPFARFRTHFYRTIAAVRRPVMVIVDDLDRCRPDFVVDLIRGIQTLLRSPRIVFLILGDRDWIERAFEAHHAAMRTVDVGPEQSFGARFVEKAIQMSFILPAVNADSQETYVRRVLLGDRAAGPRPAAPPLPPAAAAEIRRLAIHAAAAPAADRFDSAPILRQVLGEYAELNAGPHRRGAAVESQVRQIVDETLAIRSAVDDAFERELVHELEKLTRCFPQNPRQIKRIVNAIMLYYPVAIQRPDVEAGEAFRIQLALWVIIMTEWPRTWRLLASFPDLVDILASPRPRQAMRRKGVTLPGSVEATERALAPIRADPELMALIGGGKGGHAPLETRYARTLAALIPLHSRLRSLPEEAEAPLAPFAAKAS